VKKHDLTGRRFGRLVVKEIGDRVVYASGGVAQRWRCACDCGGTKDAFGGPLLDGRTQSCGCLHRERTSAARTTHGFTRDGLARGEYQSWQAMKKRCLNPRAKDFGDYGGRGIRIHPAWVDDFAAFLAHIGPRPTPAHTIERKDNEWHYEPGNVRWATRKEQARNRRSTNLIEYQGEILTIDEWSMKLGINARTLRDRIGKLGWSKEIAFTTPPLRKRSA